jgi:hypothetical protein
MKAATSLVYANRFLELCIRLEDVAKQKMDASQECEIVGQLNTVLTQMEQAVLNFDRKSIIDRQKGASLQAVSISEIQ